MTARCRPALVTCVALVLAALSVPTVASAAEPTWTVQKVADLPSDRLHAVGVWTGDALFVLGGVGVGVGSLDEVVRITPATGQVELLPQRLPVPVDRASGVWTGEEVYLFGGAHHAAAGHSEGTQDLIVRIAADGNVTPIRPRLPGNHYGAAAVWTGEVAYILGGGSCGTHVKTFCDTIVSFDPATGRVETLETRLPEDLWAHSAVWTGREILLFGGESPNRTRGNDILRFDPERGILRPSMTTLPIHQFDAAAVWTGDQALVFGESPPYRGVCRADDRCGEAISYDPTRDRARYSDLLVGYADFAVWDGTSILYSDGSTIWRASPPAPQDVNAIPWGPSVALLALAAGARLRDRLR